MVMGTEIPGLFHIHTVYSDGVLSIPEVANLARDRSAKIVSILDHACLKGCAELFRLSKNENFSVVLGYEHSIGNTDVALLGVDEILPSWWSISEIVTEVRRRDGSIIYLHPMRGNRAHLTELGEWLSKGYLDGWEYRNNLNSEILEKDLFRSPAFWGCDLHDRGEMESVPSGGMSIPSFVDRFRMSNTVKIDNKLASFKRNIQFSFAFGRIEMDSSRSHVEVSFFSEVPWGCVDELDFNGDCVEIAIPCYENRVFAKLLSFAEGREGLLQRCSLLTNKGVVQSNDLSTKNSISLKRIGSRSWKFYINRSVDRLAFSLSSKEKVKPSERRVSWPSPVWPPRSIRDLATI